MSKTLEQKPLRPWRFFFREYPAQTAGMIISLVIAGVVESVGAVSVVPLIAGLFGATPETAPLLGKIEAVFLAAGLSLTIENTLIVICMAMLGKAVLTLLAFKTSGYIEAGISTQLRSSLLDKLLNADWGYFVAQPSGALTCAISTEAQQSGLALRSFCQMLSFITQSVGYLLAGLFLSWQIMLAALGGCALFGVIFQSLIRQVRAVGITQATVMNTMASLFTDALAGAKPLKVMALEKHFMAYVRANSELYKAAARQNALTIGILASAQEPFITVVIAGGMFFSYRYMHIDGTTLLAVAFLFQRIVSRFVSAQQSYQLYSALEGVLLSLLHKIDDLDMHAEPPGGSASLTLGTSVKLENVNFSYGGRKILDGFSLDVEFGKMTALTGVSGSGKTTVADLLTGLIRPEGGRVTVDGVPLESLDRQNWRKQIGYVPQEVFLFNGTVRSNVTLGRDFSDGEVLSALERAGARKFLEAGGNALDTNVGEHGRALSGGQRQRLMIARALVARPSLLILDEATTGLDEETEREIIKHLALAKKDMAVLVISHQQAIRDICDCHIALQNKKTADEPDLSQG